MSIKLRLLSHCSKSLPLQCILNVLDYLSIMSTDDRIHNPTFSSSIFSSQKVKVGGSLNIFHLGLHRTSDWGGCSQAGLSLSWPSWAPGAILAQDSGARITQSHRLEISTGEMRTDDSITDNICAEISSDTELLPWHMTAAWGSY